MTGEQVPTVASADIARLAGVGRAAVSNWRRRFADFPKPAGGTASSPLYRLAEVEQWLATHGRGIEVDPLDRTWQALRSTVEEPALECFIAALGGLLALAEWHPDQWSRLRRQPDDIFVTAAGYSLAAEFSGLPPAASPPTRYGAALRGVVSETIFEGALRAFEFFVEQLADLRSRRVPLLPSAIRDLLVALADVRGRSVLDPACGMGDVLIAAAEAGARSVWGQDLDPPVARLAAIRILLRGGPESSDAENGREDGGVVVGDSLREDRYPSRSFGAVICDPPRADRTWGYEELASDPRWEYGLPPKGESELAWIQHCLAHAEPGGKVVALVPPTAAARRAGRRIRGNLLRAGVFRGIIALPPLVGAQSDVWVLHRPVPGERPPRDVLFLVAESIEEIIPLWTAFEADHDHFSDGRARRVAVIDLLDDEVDLSPNRFVAGPAARDYATARGEIVNALRKLADAVPALDAVDGDRRATASQEHRATTVGDLAKAGAVAVLQASQRSAEPGDALALTADDLAASRGPTGRVSDAPGAVVLRPGDVVVPVVGGQDVPVRVVGEGGPEVDALLGPRLICFRPDPARLDPQFLAGHVRAAAGSVTARTATGLSRSDSRRVPIPLLPLAEQRRRGAAFGDLAALADQLKSCLDAGTELVRGATAGLADGSLQPPEKR